MKNRPRSVGTWDLALLGVSALWLLGLLTVFRPCGPTEAGTWMPCHWAGRAAACVAGLVTALSLLRAIVPAPGFRQGLDTASIAAAGLAALMPGPLFDLCVMPQMRCRQVTAPAARVFAALTAALFAVEPISEAV